MWGLCEVICEVRFGARIFLGRFWRFESSEVSDHVAVIQSPQPIFHSACFTRDKSLLFFQKQDVNNQHNIAFWILSVNRWPLRYKCRFWSSCPSIRLLVGQWAGPFSIFETSRAAGHFVIWWIAPGYWLSEKWVYESYIGTDESGCAAANHDSFCFYVLLVGFFLFIGQTVMWRLWIFSSKNRAWNTSSKWSIFSLTIKDCLQRKQAWNAPGNEYDGLELEPFIRAGATHRSIFAISDPWSMDLVEEHPFVLLFHTRWEVGKPFCLGDDSG